MTGLGCNHFLADFIQKIVAPGNVLGGVFYPQPSKIIIGGILTKCCCKRPAIECSSRFTVKNTSLTEVLSVNAQRGLERCGARLFGSYVKNTPHTVTTISSNKK